MPASTGAGVHHPQNTIGSLRRDLCVSSTDHTEGRRTETHSVLRPDSQRNPRRLWRTRRGRLPKTWNASRGQSRRRSLCPNASHLREWLRRGFDRRSSMLFLENFTALDKKCPDCHQVPSISGVCGCDSAFRSQLRSQHSTQQVQQPASQGRDAGAWYPDKRGARVVARSLRSPTHRPDPDAFLPAANGVQPAPHVLPEPQRARRRVS